MNAVVPSVTSSSLSAALGASLVLFVTGAAAPQLTASAAAGSPPSSTAASFLCPWREDLEAVRRVDGAARTVFKKRFEAEFAAARDARARGCAAAVAAEAAALDGDNAQTLAMLEHVVASFPSLARDLRPRLALLLAEVGQIERARRELALMDERHHDARARVERALLETVKDDARSVALLRRLASQDPVALGRLCDRGEAQACQDLLVRHPRSNDARRLEREHDAGTERAMVRTGEWAHAPIVARLRALTGAARPHRAAAEGRAWLEVHRLHTRTEGQAAVAAALGEALLRTGDVAGAVSATAGFSLHSESKKSGAFDAFDVARVHAKALSRAGRIDEAVAVWRAFVDAADKSSVDRADLAAEAAFFAAFTLVEVDRVDDALAALVEARRLTVAAPSTTWETQRAWYEALLRLTAKDDARAALPLLEGLARSGDREVRKFRYWQARALRVLKRLPEADEALRNLVAEDPLDWYGQLARRDLSLTALRGVSVAPDALAQLALNKAHDEDATATQLLWSLGFDEEARTRCRARMPRAQGSVPAAQPSLVDIGVCQIVGDATSGWRRGAAFLPRVTSSTLPRTLSWRVSYAAPWLRAVDEVAAAAGVPRSFVWAIMRTESGFDPQAVSPAGARGALQLLPSVARGIAAHVGLDPGLAERLDDAHVAVLLGGHFLGLLVREHGSMLVAAAAYNGAPENAALWARRFGSLPADVFVERIPYKEARDYVKRVLAVEAIYRALDGADNASLALPPSISPATSPTSFPYLE